MGKESSCENQRKDLQRVGQRKPDDSHLDFEGRGEGEIAQDPELKGGFAEGLRQGDQV